MAGPSRRDRLTLRIFYDGECNLCARSAKWIRLLDWLTLIDRVDVHALADDELPSGATRTRLLEEMGSEDAGDRVRYGIDSLVQILLRLPLLAIVGLVLRVLFLIPPLHWVGRRMYRFIADRRYRWFGRAEQHTCEMCRK